MWFRIGEKRTFKSIPKVQKWWRWFRRWVYYISRQTFLVPSTLISLKPTLFLYLCLFVGECFKYCFICDAQTYSRTQNSQVHRCLCSGLFLYWGVARPWGQYAGSPLTYLILKFHNEAHRVGLCTSQRFTKFWCTKSVRSKPHFFRGKVSVLEGHLHSSKRSNSFSCKSRSASQIFFQIASKSI